jgi:hypothetical protein
LRFNAAFPSRVRRFVHLKVPLDSRGGENVESALVAVKVASPSPASSAAIMAAIGVVVGIIVVGTTVIVPADVLIQTPGTALPALKALIAQSFKANAPDQQTHENDDSRDKDIGVR